MSETIAVIIPHYQRHQGILARTLAAVFQQTWGSPSRVIIVDDSSPTPAENELMDLDVSQKSRIQIVKRPNGGPARAKNTGLDTLANATDFVALSDCDDIWAASHLDDAVTAMRLGHDFFFGEHIREGSEASQFAAFPIDQTQHRLLDADRELYAWRGDFFDSVLRYPIVGLSTVVFRTTRLGGLRFRDDVGLADDSTFALDVADATPAIAYGRRLQTVYGLGDNLSVVREWRSNKALFNIASLAQCNAVILATKRLDAAQRRFVIDRLKQCRRDFAVTLLAMLKARVSIDGALVRSFLRDQPATLLSIPSAVLEGLSLRSLRSFC